MDFLDPNQEETTAHVSTSKTFIAVMLSMALGGLLGLGLELTDPDLPFFLEEVLLGTICATVTAFSLGKIQELPEGVIFGRLGPAASYGALVGLCLFAIWWTFDPSAGFIAIGAIAGICSGIPVAVSFGLMGGQSRPLGTLEFGNVLISMAGGFGIGMLVVLGSEYDMDFSIIPGIGGILALVPTLFGGRINLKDMAEMLPQGGGDDW